MQEEGSAVKRLGSTSIIENMGIMLLFAFLLLVALLCLAGVALVVKYVPEATGVYMKLK